MLIRIPKGWELPESAATPESLFRNRRRLIKAAAAGPILLGAPALLTACDDGDPAERAALEAGAKIPDPSAKLYPVDRNPKFTLDRPLTAEKLATTYTNYYEFGSSKNIHEKAQRLPIRPWTVTIAGQVEKEFEIGLPPGENLSRDALLRDGLRASIEKILLAASGQKLALKVTLKDGLVVPAPPLTEIEDVPEASAAVDEAAAAPSPAEPGAAEGVLTLRLSDCGCRRRAAVSRHRRPRKLRLRRPTSVVRLGVPGPAAAAKHRSPAR